MFIEELTQLTFPLLPAEDDNAVQNCLDNLDWTATVADYLPQRFIAKRTGGLRKIQEPKPYLKTIQTAITHALSRFYGPSKYAHAFIRAKKGRVRNLRSNALPHMGHKYLLKIDLKDFFPSCSPQLVGKALRFGVDLPDWLYNLVMRACFLDRGLPQGAPSSPILSNITARELDYRLARLCEAWRREPATNHGPYKNPRMDPIAYTRYADDITFSSNYDLLEPELRKRERRGERISAELLIGKRVWALHNILHPVRIIVEDCGFKVKEKKVKKFKTPQRLEVCGVVIGQNTVNARRRQRRYWRGRLHKIIRDIELSVVPPNHRLDEEGNLRRITRKYLRKTQGKIAAIVAVSPQLKPYFFGGVDEKGETWRGELKYLRNLCKRS